MSRKKKHTPKRPQNNINSVDITQNNTPVSEKVTTAETTETEKKSETFVSAIIETEDKIINVIPKKEEEKASVKENNITEKALNPLKKIKKEKPVKENNKKEKSEKVSYFKEFTKGIIKENPVLVGLLGMCPTLAVTSTAINGIGMGLATTFVLVCSNIVISLLKNVIPKAVRLPSFIVIIAGFVTFTSFILEGFVPSLYDALGVYLALITVNCIILGRAEVFASKNKVIPSIFDGLGMGIGFTGALFVIGAIREILGSGKIFGFAIPVIEPMLIFIFPAGGFFVLGCVIALVNKIAKRKPPQELGCNSCPNSASCKGCEKGGND